GGSGGAINGSAAVSRSAVNGTSSIAVGDGVKILSGVDPLSAPGGITMSATSRFDSSDKTTLSSGGLLYAGSRVESTLNAAFTDSVSIGAKSTFLSAGNIGVGTATQAIADNEAYGNTFGGFDSICEAYANSNLTSNQDVSIGKDTTITAAGNVNLTAGNDPQGLVSTDVEGNAKAESYAQALVGVPKAEANSAVASNTTLTIASGTAVGSGLNVVLGAYSGTVKAATSGIGHAYAFFIPITETGTNNPSESSTAKVVQNGTITSGLFHELDITIPKDSPSTPLVNADASPYFPLSYAYDEEFDAVKFINDNFGADSPEAQSLDAGVSTTPVTALTLGGLFASGGTVTVNADDLSGTGHITAYGGPKITVTNESASYLILGGMKIPNIPGGTVSFTGKATSAPFPTDQIAGTSTPTITINQNNEDPVGTSTYGPALFLTGDITNLGGLVQIVNLAGSYGQTASIFGQRVSISVPNGSAVISNPTGTYYVGSDPYAEWQSFMMWPGGNPANGAPDPEQAGAYITSRDYTWGRAFELATRSPTLKSTDSFGSADLTGSQDSEAVFGNQITINAKTVDINAQLKAGKTSPNRSVVLSADLGATLTAYRQAYAGQSEENPIYEIPLNDLWTTNGDDAKIAASYNAETNQITVDDVAASSGGGGSVTIQGAILNTNTLGQIQVIGGIGQVDITNLTGLPLVVKNIDADSGSSTASVSRVQITDTNQPTASQQALYVYNPRTGITVYQGSAGETLGAGTPTSTISGNTTQYTPEAGLRWQWTEHAFLSKTTNFSGSLPANTGEFPEFLNILATDPNPWYWDVEPNDPWKYEDPTTGKDVAAPVGETIVQLSSLAFVESMISTIYMRRLDSGVVHVQTNMIMTNSVRADNPIGISFLGNTTGNVSISSNADVILSGLIANPTGGTAIASQPGKLTQNETASIVTKNLTLNATAGIGSTSQLVNATLTAGGAVTSASGSGGNYLRLNSGAYGSSG
ncbi:beta strand repeat-containing protein, partial [Singulisphaera rosea]